MMHLIHSTLRYFERLEQHHWMWLFIGMVAFGIFCMRGFGSRSNY